MSKIPALSAMIVVVACIALLSSGADGGGAAVKTEMEKFQGTWYSIATERNGKQKSSEDKTALHVFTGKRWVQTEKGRVEAEGSFTVEERKPFWIVDFKYTSKKDKGTHWIAIYRFEGDTLQWIANEEDFEKLPKAFKTSKGDGLFMRTLKLSK